MGGHPLGAELRLLVREAMMAPGMALSCKSGMRTRLKYSHSLPGKSNLATQVLDAKPDTDDLDGPVDVVDVTAKSRSFGHVPQMPL